MNTELALGGRFVVFDYTISALVVTWRRSSPVFFVRAGHSARLAGMAYSLLSLAVGILGPGGWEETRDVLRQNRQGGRDITSEMLRLTARETAFSV